MTAFCSVKLRDHGLGLKGGREQGLGLSSMPKRPGSKLRSLGEVKQAKSHTQEAEREKEKIRS
jgi:hypothetical protein